MGRAAKTSEVASLTGYLFSLATARLEDAAFWAAECQSPRCGKRIVKLNIGRIKTAVADVNALIDVVDAVAHFDEMSSTINRRKKLRR